jgi:hypothetical protein
MMSKPAKPRSHPLFPGYPTLASAGLFLCLSGCSSYTSETGDAGQGIGGNGAKAGSSTRGSSGGYNYGGSSGSYGPSYISSSTRPTNSGGVSGASGGQGGSDSGSTPAWDAGINGADQDDANSGDVPPPKPDAR